MRLKNKTMKRINLCFLNLLAVWILSAQSIDQLSYPVFIDKGISLGLITAFESRDDPFKYYYLPNYVRLQNDPVSGTPLIGFQQYVQNEKSAADTEETKTKGAGGGFFWMTVGFNLSPEELRSSEQRLQQTKPGARIVGSMAYESGQAELVSFGAGANKETEVLGIGNAPLMENDAIAVGMILNAENATKLYASLRLPNPNIGMSFKMNFRGFSSPIGAKIIMNLDKIYSDKRMSAAIQVPKLGFEIEKMTTDFIDNGAIKIIKVGDLSDKEEEILNEVLSEFKDQFFEQSPNITLLSQSIANEPSPMDKLNAAKKEYPEFKQPSGDQEVSKPQDPISSPPKSPTQGTSIDPAVKPEVSPPAATSPVSKPELPSPQPQDTVKLDLNPPLPPSPAKGNITPATTKPSLPDNIKPKPNQKGPFLEKYDEENHYPDYSPGTNNNLPFVEQILKEIIYFSTPEIYRLFQGENQKELKTYFEYIDQKKYHAAGRGFDRLYALKREPIEVKLLFNAAICWAAASSEQITLKAKQSYLKEAKDRIVQLQIVASKSDEGLRDKSNKLLTLIDIEMQNDPKAVSTPSPIVSSSNGSVVTSTTPDLNQDKNTDPNKVQPRVLAPPDMAIPVMNPPPPPQANVTHTQPNTQQSTTAAPIKTQSVTETLNAIPVSAYMGYKVKKVRERGEKTFELSKTRTASRTRSIGLTLPRIPSTHIQQINLDDALYTQREVTAILNGQNVKDFAQYINYVSIKLRKRHPQGDISNDEIIVDRNNFNKNGNRFKLLYGWRPGDNNRRTWLDYEYKTVWSYHGGGIIEQDWNTSDDGAINLSSPCTKSIINLNGNIDNLKSKGVRSVQVRISYALGGSNQTKIKSINIEKVSELVENIEIIQPNEISEYQYDITWTLAGNVIKKSAILTTDALNLFIDELLE